MIRPAPNVGATNSNATWIDWDANNGTCAASGHHHSGGGTTKATCSGTWTPAAHSTWNGCITDRGTTNAPSSGNYDTNVVTPTTTIPATPFSRRATRQLRPFKVPSKRHGDNI